MTFPAISSRNPHASSDVLAVPRYFRIRDVMRLTGLRRPTIYRRIAERRFPPSINLGGRACGWSIDVIQAWFRDPQRYRIETPRAHLAVEGY